MNVEPQFRAYQAVDRLACLTLFDANCPAYFAPNERIDYAQFLDSRADHYQICISPGRIVGAYGLYPDNADGCALHWILLSPLAQGRGLGSIFMTRVLDEAGNAGRSIIHISASNKSSPFFARFGAVELSRLQNGWGPGMHRVEMRLSLRAPAA